jgi:hypothetical protein
MESPRPPPPVLVAHPAQAAAYWEAQFRALKTKYDELLEWCRGETSPSSGKQSHQGRGRGTSANPPTHQGRSGLANPDRTSRDIGRPPQVECKELRQENPPPPTPRQQNAAAWRSYRAKIRTLVKEKKGQIAPPESACTIIEKQGDLLSAPEQFKMHAVAADLKCSKGLAAKVVEKYGRPTQVPDNLKPGDIVSHPFSEDEVILFLVSKIKSFHKPRRRHFAKFLSHVHEALDGFAKFVIEREIEEIAIPYLCCGLDRMNWLYVKDYLRRALQSSTVRVVVYHLPRRPSAEPPTPPSAAPPMAAQQGTQVSPTVAVLRERFEARNLDDFPELPFPMSSPRRTNRLRIPARESKNFEPPVDVRETSSFVSVSDNQAQINNHVPIPNNPISPTHF